jgi:hypothetical protein
LLRVLSLLIILSFQIGNAQEAEKAIADLRADLGEFKYIEVLEKGQDYLQFAKTAKDSVAILKQMLTAAFSLQNEQLTRDLCRHIVAVDPKATLEPRYFSPKLITIFEGERQGLIDLDSSTTQVPVSVDTVYLPQTQWPAPIKPWQAIMTTLIPGSGQVLQDQPSGYYLLIGTVVIGGSLIYAQVQYSDNRDAYLRAQPGADFDNLFNAYQTSNYWRNGLAIAYAGLGLFSLYDLLEDQQQHKSASPIIKNTPNGPQVGILLFLQ